MKEKVGKDERAETIANDLSHQLDMPIGIASLEAQALIDFSGGQPVRVGNTVSPESSVITSMALTLFPESDRPLKIIFPHCHLLGDQRYDFKVLYGEEEEIKGNMSRLACEEGTLLINSEEGDTVVTHAIRREQGVLFFETNR